MSQVDYLDTSRCEVNSSTFLPPIWFHQLLSSPRSYSTYVWLTPILFTLAVTNNTLLLSQSLYTSSSIAYAITLPPCDWLDLISVVPVSIPRRRIVNSPLLSLAILTMSSYVSLSYCLLNLFTMALKRPHWKAVN